MNLEDEIKDFIKNHFKVEKLKITREADLEADLGADSLDRIELQMNLEEKYKIKIPDEEAGKLKTVGNIIDYVALHYKV